MICVIVHSIVKNVSKKLRTSRNERFFNIYIKLWEGVDKIECLELATTIVAFPGLPYVSCSEDSKQAYFSYLNNFVFWYNNYFCLQNLFIATFILYSSG